MTHCRSPMDWNDASSTFATVRRVAGRDIGQACGRLLRHDAGGLGRLASGSVLSSQSSRGAMFIDTVDRTNDGCRRCSPIPRRQDLHLGRRPADAHRGRQGLQFTWSPPAIAMRSW